MSEAYTFEGRAMGTDYGIEIVCSEKAQAEALAREAISEIESAETRFSRFIEESELSKLNRERRMEVSSAFLAVIEHAYDLFVRTHGIFNPLVQVGRLGYDKSFELLDDDAPLTNDGPYDIDFTTTEIDRKKSVIGLKEGQLLDVGGFLKGYLAQLIAERIMDAGTRIRGVIINIGGDLCALGTDKDGAHFEFGIHDPHTEGTAVYRLEGECLATSGTYKRVWNSGGAKRNHIIVENGRGNPQSGIISASVAHHDGGAAEAFAKVFLIAGESEARRILSRERLRYTLITTVGMITSNTL